MDLTDHRECSLAIGIAVRKAKESNVDLGEAGEANSTHRSLQRHDVRPDAVEATRLIVIHRADDVVLDKLKIFKLLLQDLPVDIWHELGSKAQN